MESIVDHNTDGHAIYWADMHIKHGSNTQVRKTTKGWYLCVEWKDRITSLERLSDLKESNPVEVVKYAVSKNLLDAPAFAWWVPYVLKKCSHIIAAVTNIYHNRTHKFGTEVPKKWEDCVKLDKENCNNLWRYSVRKETKNVCIAFQILNGYKAVPPIYQEIRCHMIFDIKMEDFQRKARFVDGGQTTDTSHAMTYASVVSRDSM
jgi:hypothetical protein